MNSASEFQAWFNLVKIEAEKQKASYLIATQDPESYREYFEDGDTPAAVVQAELAAARKQKYPWTKRNHS